MSVSARAAAQLSRRLRRSASIAFVVSTWIVACADRDVSLAGGAGGDASPDLPQPANEAGTRAGGGGQQRPSDGGSSGGDDGGSGDGAESPLPGGPSDGGSRTAGGSDGAGGSGGASSEAGAAGGGEAAEAGGAGGSRAAGAAGEGGSEAGDERGLPCDVLTLLRTRCQTCHSSQPTAGAGISLMSYANLAAASKLDASVTVAARSLQRMRDSLAPMPPLPATPPTLSDLAPLKAWVEAGLPRGQCDEGQSSNPYDAPPNCTSGGYWTAWDSGTPWMNPGLACIQCHRQSPNFAPLFTVAGTVYPTAHEPDKCWGVPAATGAQVIIIDAHGQQLGPIPVVSGGNFGVILSGLALPYQAKVVVGDRERVMLTPQMSGDCNVCHTQNGTQGALGRLIVP